MKRYQFRLQQVLRVRRVQADQAAAALGVAQRAETGAIAAELARHETVATRPRPAGGYQGDELLADRVVWDAQLESLHRLAAARISARLLTTERRAQWTVASTRVKALELLDERRRDEHRLEWDRAEAHRVDDLVASRHGRTHEGRR